MLKILSKDVRNVKIIKKRCNGLTERSGQTIVESLRKFCEKFAKYSFGRERNNFEDFCKIEDCLFNSSLIQIKDLLYTFQPTA